jgi:hypothetical protein
MPWSSALSWFSLPCGGTRCHVPSILRVGSTLSLIQDRASSEDESDSRSESIRRLDAREPRGDTVGPSHYHVRIHLRLSVFEGDVANQRKQFHLFVENAGWIVIFRFPVEPTQLRVRKRADGFRATSPNGASRTVAARLRPRRSRTLRQEPSVPSGFVSNAARQGIFTFSEA